MTTAERNTRQRDAIKAALESAQRPLSTHEILQAANAQVQGLGIATIYRNLKSFLQSGEIAQVTIPGDNPRYEISGHAHHHHFHCTRCDRLFDVHQCPGDLKNMAPPGFAVERHELTLYGQCADCQKAS
jgi:Fur family ferric uptake transcriptional regulator